MTALLSRDEALALMLPLVPTHGWTMATLRRALKEAGAEEIDAEILFPGGRLELVEAFIARANAAMETAATELDLPAMRLSDRVRALIAARLRLMQPHKDAVRRSLAVLAPHPKTAARTTATTVDTIWHLAGDTAADFSWYTKRATLAAIYTATLLFWLRDTSEDDTETLAFLDRRLAGTARIGKLRRRVEDGLSRFKPAA
jgi:ubiquinone biosynthesis protein COQ9